MTRRDGRPPKKPEFWIPKSLTPSETLEIFPTHDQLGRRIRTRRGAASLNCSGIDRLDPKPIKV